MIRFEPNAIVQDAKKTFNKLENLQGDCCGRKSRKRNTENHKSVI